MASSGVIRRRRGLFALDGLDGGAADEDHEGEGAQHAEQHEDLTARARALVQVHLRAAASDGQRQPAAAAVSGSAVRAARWSSVELGGDRCSSCTCVFASE